MSRQDLIPQLIQESREILDQSESLLLELENKKKNNQFIPQESIHTLFRYFHTLKGSSALFGLKTIVQITHEAESLLDTIRNSNDPILIIEYIDVLLKTIDLLRSLFDIVETTNQNPNTNDEILKFENTLKQINQNLKSKTPPTSANYGFFDEEPIPKKQENQNYGFFEDEVPTTKEATEPQQTHKEPADQELLKEPIQNEPAIAENLEKKKEIKISTEKIDLLLELVGELVIAESNVSSHPEIEKLKLEGFRQATRHLNKIVRELQEVAFSTRMIPISGLFNRMKRLVRDLENKTKKKVQLLISGEDTEIDKSIVDFLQDPIIHIIRNAVDHGIENPKERLESGKQEIGTIRLHAFQSTNEVWILIIDDGRGLNRKKIIDKAYQKGIIPSLDFPLTDKEIFELIFYPGFSTAEQVSDLSGRGVGMDIVRKNIENLGGKIEILSEEGVGTRITIRIPLSLGIMEGTVFKISESFFTLQTTEIKELIQLENSKIIEIYSGQKVINVRGNFYPIFYIHELLNLKNPPQYNEKDLILILIEKEEQRFGIIADSILGNQSIVIKPFSKILKKAKGVNGYTILGNGKISLILNTKYIFEKFVKKINQEKVVHQ